jgi:hypothetical protein
MYFLTSRSGAAHALPWAVSVLPRIKMGAFSRTVSHALRLSIAKTLPHKLPARGCCSGTLAS